MYTELESRAGTVRVTLAGTVCDILDTITGRSMSVNDVIGGWLRQTGSVCLALDRPGDYAELYEFNPTDGEDSLYVGYGQVHGKWITAEARIRVPNRGPHRMKCILLERGVLDHRPKSVRYVNLFTTKWSADLSRLSIVTDELNVWTWTAGDRRIRLLSRLDRSGFVILDNSYSYWSPNSRWLLVVTSGSRPNPHELYPDEGTENNWLSDNPESSTYAISVLDAVERRVVVRFILDDYYDQSLTNDRITLYCVKTYGSRRVPKKLVHIDLSGGQVTVDNMIEFL